MANGTISEEEWLDLYRHLLTEKINNEKLCVRARHGTRPKVTRISLQRRAMAAATMVSVNFRVVMRLHSATVLLRMARV